MRIIFFAIALLAFHAAAAQQVCVCTAGCKIASDSYPSTGPQPTSCAVYKAGVQIANAPVVASSGIPVSNAGVCAPASAAYVQGPAGSVSCEVLIPNQPAGSVTLTMTATNAAGETAQSAPFTFQSVSALPTLPSVPVNLRPN